MSVKVTVKENSIVELSTSVGGKEFEEAKEKALKKLASKIQIKGFRKGNAPISMVKDRISTYEILNEAINLSLNGAYNAAVNEALKENAGVRPYNSPSVNVTKLDETGYEVTFTYTSMPSVKLGQYKGLNVALEVAKVGAKEVDAAIDALVNENAMLVLKEGPAAMGDTVVFDFKGYINGKEFEGGSADNYSLVLGSNQFIPGFEEQLVGAVADSKVDVLVKFPEQYVKDLAGKDAKFVCMIHEVKTNEKPELNDEFVASLDMKNAKGEEIKTLEDLKKYEKETLKAKAERDAKDAQFNATLEQIIANAEVTIGETILKNEAEELKKNLLGQLQQNGLTYEQYKQITGLTEEAIEAQFVDQARAEVKRNLVIDTVGRTEHLTITREDIENFYKNIAAQYSMEVEAVKRAYGNNDQAVANQLFSQKIMNFIRLNNNVEEEAKAEEKPAKKATKKAAPKAEEVVAEEKPAKKPAAKKTTAKKSTKKEVKEEAAE